MTKIMINNVLRDMTSEEETEKTLMKHSIGFMRIHHEEITSKGKFFY